MNKDLDIKSLKDKLANLWPKLAKHASFAAVMFILLIYIFTVWKISRLATAEPSSEDQSSAEITAVPKVDQKAINQVQSLENSSPQVHSLFNTARNNPFNE